MYPKDVQAAKIDAGWHTFLKQEKGWTAHHIGDYYVIGIDGTEWLLTAAQFNRLFFEVEVADGAP
jgi:hypothetical protein